MEITEFFDPYNMEHIKAYKTLMEKGTGPANFLPEGIIFSIAWHEVLTHKMANAWVEQVLAGNVVGMPPVEHKEDLQLRKVPPYAYFMSVDEFFNSCRSGAFTDFDGTGYYATKYKMMSEKTIEPSEALKGNIDTNFTHIAWINK